MSPIPTRSMVAFAALGLVQLAGDELFPSADRSGPDAPRTELRVQQRHELALERDFPARAGGILSVNVPDGDVEVLPGAGGGVAVKVYVWSRDRTWGRSVFERMRFVARETRDGVQVTADDPHIRDEEWRRHHGFSVRISIEVPPTFNTEILTRDGDIRLGDLQGQMEIRSHDGDIVMGRITGPSISIRTADGDISARALSAETIELETSDGDVDVREASGTLRVSTGDGDIRISLTNPKEVWLRTRDGDISIYADRTLQADLDLFGEDLRLESAFRVQVSRISDRSVRGSINGGGPLLEARTVDGTIALRLR